MLKGYQQNITCLDCGQDTETVLWASININLDPALREKLFAGKVNQFTCNHCGVEKYVDADLLYHDVDNSFCVQYYPFAYLETEGFFDNFFSNGKVDPQTPCH